MAGNVYLVGMMGAGKTTLGKALAHKTGQEFVDTDRLLVERTGVPVATIFEIEGEAGFRRRESDLLAELSERNGIVLATGGGAVIDADNRQALGGRGLVVYLHATVQQQLARTQRCENRPLLQAPDRREVLERLLRERDPLYREIADLVLESDGHNAKWLVKEIERHLDQPVGAS